jgi:hypothetical protein
VKARWVPTLAPTSDVPAISFRFALPAIIGTPTSRDPLCGYPAVAPSAGKATTRKRVPRDSQRLAPLVVLDTLLLAAGSFIHIRFSRPYCVRIYGKGRRERTCPPWIETIEAIKASIEDRHLRLSDNEPLFVNAKGQRLSRYGLRYMVAHKWRQRGRPVPPSSRGRSLLTRGVIIRSARLCRQRPYQRGNRFEYCSTSPLLNGIIRGIF